MYYLSVTPGIEVYYWSVTPGILLQARELRCLVQYMYLGESQVQSQQLDTFLQVGEELGICGLIKRGKDDLELDGAILITRFHFPLLIQTHLPVSYRPVSHRIWQESHENMCCLSQRLECNPQTVLTS